jgi:hypothetical protein
LGQTFFSLSLICPAVVQSTGIRTFLGRELDWIHLGFACQPGFAWFEFFLELLPEIDNLTHKKSSNQLFVF